VNPLRSRFELCSPLACLLLFAAPAARAAIVPVGPFAGTTSETWESFPNLSDQFVATGSFFLADPAPIMGGFATISHPRLAIYEPAASAIFRIGSSGVAAVSDGAKAGGIDGDSGATTIVFSGTVTHFGAYFGAVTGPDFPFPNPNAVTVSFYDASDNLIGSAAFDYSRASSRDGVLEWHGWRSASGGGTSGGVGIKKITVSGDYVALDGLQVLPEPGLLVSLASGAALAAFARRRTPAGSLSCS
jgi:hypothetical protein